MDKRIRKNGVCRAKVRPRTEAEIAALLAVPIQTLAITMVAIVMGAVESANTPEDGEPGDEWIRHDRSPLGARRTRELAKRGAFPGARKVGRRWMIPRSALNAFIERQGTASSANDNADEGGDPAVQALASELGYDLAPSDSERRKKR